MKKLQRQRKLKMKTTNNAFNWRGQPSIFTTRKALHEFGGLHTGISQRASERHNEGGILAEVVLPGSSKNRMPKMDALKKGGERGRRA